MGETQDMQGVCRWRVETLARLGTNQALISRWRSWAFPVLYYMDSIRQQSIVPPGTQRCFSYSIHASKSSLTTRTRVMGSRKPRKNLDGAIINLASVFYLVNLIQRVPVSSFLYPRSLVLLFYVAQRRYKLQD